MIVSKDDYLKYCHNADIPVTKKERRILDEQTAINGMFSVEGYIAKCASEKVFLTNNQKKILKKLPTPEDDEWTVMGKHSALKLMAYEIYRSNKRGA